MDREQVELGVQLYNELGPVIEGIDIACKLWSNSTVGLRIDDGSISNELSLRYTRDGVPQNAHRIALSKEESEQLHNDVSRVIYEFLLKKKGTLEKQIKELQS